MSIDDRRDRARDATSPRPDRDRQAAAYESGLRDGMRGGAREARDAGFEGRRASPATATCRSWRRASWTGRSAEVALREGLQYADAIEQSHCRQMMAATAALTSTGAAGRWDAADERARQRAGRPRLPARHRSARCDVIGLVALGRGRPDEARRWLDESLATAGRIGEVEFDPAAAVGPGRDGPARRRPGAAARAMRRGLEIARTTGERALLRAVRRDRRAGRMAARRPDEAERWLARARKHLADWESVAGPALAHADGLIRLAGGSLAPHARALETRRARLGGARAHLGSDRGRGSTLRRASCASNRYAEAVDARRRGPRDRRPSSAARRSSRAPRSCSEASRGRGLRRRAVAAAHRPRVRGRAADRRRHDQRRDRGGAVRRRQRP